jgi:hypothetical protein
MTRAILTLLAVVFLSAAVSAQTADQPSSQPECTLTLATSPAIRGLKLGMSTEQLLALFPGSNQNVVIKGAIDNAQGYPNYGIARVSFTQPEYPAVFKDRFAGVDSIQVVLFDGQASNIRVSYAGLFSRPRGPYWPNVEAFIAKLTEAFILPDVRAWVSTSLKSKALKCSGFEIHASSENSAEVSLFNIQYEKTAQQRATADEEKRRREFKP